MSDTDNIQPVPHRALVVEAFEDLRILEQAVLRRGGFDVVATGDTEDALRLLGEHSFSVVVVASPLRQGKTPVLEWLEERRHPVRRSVIVLTTAHRDQEFLLRARRCGVCCILSKPFSPLDLIEAATICASRTAGATPGSLSRRS